MKTLSCVIACCFFHCLIFAQTITDSASTDLSLKNTISIYYHSTGENLHLNNGSEYAGYDINRIGNPYFDTTAMQPGSICYDGTLYNNVPLLYDLYEDAVITNRYKRDGKIRLINEKIVFFTFLSHEFIRIVPDSASKSFMSIGFYDRVYNGKISVLVKRKKITKDDPVINGEMKSRYIALENYFIKKGGACFPVRTEKSVVRLLKDKQKELRGFIKKNKLSFKKRPEYAIVQVAQYYDQLTKGI